jgi:cell division protein FtsB
MASDRRRAMKVVRGALGPALAIFAVVAMAGYAVFGPTGLYAWGDYSQDVARKGKELAALKKREAELQNQVTLLDPRHADPDLSDELVRRELGVAHPDEVIVPLD